MELQDGVSPGQSLLRKCLLCWGDHSDVSCRRRVRCSLQVDCPLRSAQDEVDGVWVWWNTAWNGNLLFS